ncbi:hypothetical protein EMN47_16185 [Prolixibacteraceae bacterium JC049]|nr:hypothetical protein [Prolixibacteraceae bacterium JC049]
MKPIIRNVIAVVLGWIVGSAVNMGLIKLGHQVFPIEGVDINDMEALAAVMPTLGSEFFLFPFLAHALGTLVGAAIAAIIAFKHKLKMAMFVGVLFLLGGIMVNMMLPGPTWFTVVDLVVAYIPMAWIGGVITQKITK